MTNFRLKDILPLLKNMRKNGSGFTARCPSHDDQKNSLAVKEAASGKVLFKCFAGCTYQEIISALGISPNGDGHRKQIEEIYDYTDESGNVLYQNVRYKGKEFRWRHLDTNGREVWNLKGVRRVPYRLADLVKLTSDCDSVMTEGEKDADTLTVIGLTATSHKNWNPEYNYLLKGKRVIIHQDHDRVGAKMAKKAAQEIYRDVQSLKIVDCFASEPLPEKHGKDVSDYLQSHSKDELLELIRATPDWKPKEKGEAPSESNRGKFKVICLSDVRAKEIVWLWKPFIPIGEFTIIEGIEGLGKSWFTCALAYAVAAGVTLPFSDSVPMPPARVLMLSGEDSLSHTVTPD